MLIMKNNFFIFFLCVLIQWGQTAAYAQNSILSGTVVDENHQPLAYVTIRLTAPERETVGGMTDEDGGFRLSVENGDYRIAFSYVGYENFWKDARINGDTDMGPIVMMRQNARLDDAVVTGNKPLVTREIDRIIFHAAQLTSVSSNALDLMKHTPGLMVSESDDIQVIGKGSIIVLVNGRELKLLGKELSSYLRSINSSEIENIEVMTIPPARYSAEGNAGIVNLVMKKHFSDFFGGYFSDLNYFTHSSNANDYAGNIQYKKDAVSSFFNVSGGLGKRKYEGSRTFRYLSEQWDNEYTQKVSNYFLTIRGGIDISLPAQWTIGANIAWLDFTPNLDKYEATRIRPKDGTIERRFTGYDLSDRRQNRFNANIHVDKEFEDTDKSISFDFDYIGYMVSDNESYRSEERKIFYENILDRNVRIGSSKIDFYLPFERYIVTAGGAFSYARTENDVRYLQQNLLENRDDRFIYKESIAAVYGDVLFDVGSKMAMKLGIRCEYAKTAGTSAESTKTSDNARLNIFPVAYLRYVPHRNHVFHASLASRIGRPNYSHVNPFGRYLNPNNIEIGNPCLKPERSWLTEMGYTLNNNLTFSLGGRFTDDIIDRRVVFDDGSKLNRYTWDNYLKNRIYISTITYRFHRLSWYECYMMHNFYYLGYESKIPELPLSASQWAYLGYCSNSFFFNKKKTWVAQLSGQYSTQEKSIDRITKGRYYIHSSIKYILPEHNLEIGFSVQDLFSSGYRGTEFSNGIEKDWTDKTLRTYKISVNYKFGLKIREQKRGNRDFENRL